MMKKGKVMLDIESLGVLHETKEENTILSYTDY